jgi:hypothetical protein
VTVFWASLGFMIVAFIAGGVVVLVRALETRRAVKGLKAALDVELQRIATAGEHTTEQLEATTEKFERLDAGLKRFSTAQAQLRLINEALGEAEALKTRARAFIPSK